MKKTIFIIISALLIFGCNKPTKHINIKNNTITIHHNETVSIGAISSLPINYTSGDNYHATVDNDGNVTGIYVGSTKIRLENGKDTKFINVNVIPRYNIYTEPNIRIGESEQSIISRFGEPDSTWYGFGNPYFYYMNEGSVSYILYVGFASSKVEYYGLGAIDKNLYEQLWEFLDERYYYLTTTDGTNIFYNSINISEATTKITLGKNVIAGCNVRYQRP